MLACPFSNPLHKTQLFKSKWRHNLKSAQISKLLHLLTVARENSLWYPVTFEGGNSGRCSNDSVIVFPFHCTWATESSLFVELKDCCLSRARGIKHICDPLHRWGLSNAHICVSSYRALLFCSEYKWDLYRMGNLQVPATKGTKIENRKMPITSSLLNDPSFNYYTNKWESFSNIYLASFLSQMNFKYQYDCDLSLTKLPITITAYLGPHFYV